MIDLNQIIASVITAVILALVTLVINKVNKWLNAIIVERELKVDSELVDSLMASFKTTLTQAIIATNQTYVNDLKKNGQFTKEAAAEAMKMTTDYCMKMMASDVLEYLNETYTDVNSLIAATAEAIIGASKGNTVVDAEVVVGTIVDYLSKLPSNKQYTMQEIVTDIRTKFDIPE